MQVAFTARRRLSLLALAVCSVSGNAHAGSADPSQMGNERGSALVTAPAMTDQLIIRYRDASAGHFRATLQSMAQAHAVLNQAGVQMQPLRRTADLAHVMRLDARVDARRLADIARAMQAADPDIEYIEPDLMLRPLLTPTDSRYLEQWHYYEATGGLNAPTAWDSSTGSGVVVAVLDTGYRPHADLAGNIVAGYDMIIDTAVANDGDGRDGSALDPGDWTIVGECGGGSGASNSSWHGTHVAGTIAAVTNNAAGVAGVAFGARVQPVRVLGKCGGYTSDIADGITWASGGSVPGAPANATPP